MEEDKARKIHDAKKRKELKAKNEAWSSKTEKIETKQERREKMKRKREAIEKQLMDDSSYEETQVDWKEMVKTNKKKKTTSNSMQGSFDDL